VNKKDDGGPAFPDPTGDYVGREGMSLRDWFAGQAMSACAAAYPNVKEWQLKKWFGDRSGIYAEEVIARMAYEVADAMLKARKS
jgi:hypothetical protein